MCKSTAIIDQICDSRGTKAIMLKYFQRKKTFWNKFGINLQDCVKLFLLWILSGWTNLESMCIVIDNLEQYTCIKSIIIGFGCFNQRRDWFFGVLCLDECTVCSFAFDAIFFSNSKTYCLKFSLKNSIARWWMLKWKKFKGEKMKNI